MVATSYLPIVLAFDDWVRCYLLTDRYEPHILLVMLIFFCNYRLCCSSCRNDMDPDERPQNFIPKKHRSMREVGVYQNGIQERFERCLDLYLCPMKRRLNNDPESLVPKLPKPRSYGRFRQLCAPHLMVIGACGCARHVTHRPIHGLWLR